MALTVGDKAECKEIAREIIKEVLAEHIQLCPWGNKIRKYFFILMGVFIGAGIISGAGAVNLIELIKTLLTIK